MSQLIDIHVPKTCLNPAGQFRFAKGDHKVSPAVAKQLIDAGLATAAETPLEIVPPAPTIPLKSAKEAHNVKPQTDDKETK